MFRTIPKYEGYSINEDGVVMNRKTRRILKQSISKNGYRRVNLYNKGVGKVKTIHKLMSLAFFNFDSTFIWCINHKDCNKLNNNLSNLEIVSQHQNREHAKINGRHKNAIEAMREAHKRQRKLTDDQVRDIRMNHRHKIVPYRYFAEKYNVTLGVVKGVFNNNYKDVK